MSKLAALHVFACKLSSRSDAATSDKDHVVIAETIGDVLKGMPDRLITCCVSCTITINHIGLLQEIPGFPEIIKKKEADTDLA